MAGMTRLKLWTMRRPSTEPSPAPADAGFTLVEAIISLALFALIALAGFGLLDSVLNVQHRTQDSLDELGRMQRAMLIVDQDFTRLSQGPWIEADKAMILARATLAGERTKIRYRLTDDRLERVIGDGSAPRVQVLLDKVAGLTWTCFEAGAWRPDCPPAPDMTAPDTVGPAVARPRPAAVALTIVLAGRAPMRGGTLRRVMRPPAQP